MVEQSFEIKSKHHFWLLYKSMGLNCACIWVHISQATAPLHYTADNFMRKNADTVQLNKRREGILWIEYDTG